MTQVQDSIDVIVENHDSIFLFRPLTDAAREWIDDNVDADAQWFGGAVAVEPRYAYPLAGGMVSSGLVVK